MYLRLPVSDDLYDISVRISDHALIVTIPGNAGLTGDRVSIHPETFDHLIHLLLLIRVKGQMSQADMILVVSLSNILPLHDLQGRATLERDEIRGESFFRIHIFLITLTIKILYIEIP